MQKNSSATRSVDGSPVGPVASRSSHSHALTLLRASTSVAPWLQRNWGRRRRVLAACFLTLFALSCDRSRTNPLDPQSDFVRNRPATPTGLAAEAGVGVIRLQWLPVGDGDLAGYAVFRSEMADRSYRFVEGDGDLTRQITTGKTSFVDSLDAYGMTFFYRVAAVDTTGLRSELSGFVGETVQNDVVAPEPPLNVSVVADEDVPGRIVVRWSAPQRDADGGELSGLTGYVVMRAEAGTGGALPIDTVAVSPREYEATSAPSVVASGT